MTSRISQLSARAWLAGGVLALCVAAAPAAQALTAAAGADADTALGVNVATGSAILAVPSGAGLAQLGGLGGAGSFDQLGLESATMSTMAERRLGGSHWLGVSFALRATSSQSRQLFGSSTTVATSTSFGAVAALSWRMVWNPGGKVEIGPYAAAGYRRGTSESITERTSSTPEDEGEDVARSSNDGAVGAAGLNLDAHLTEHIGVRLAVQLASVEWTRSSSIAPVNSVVAAAPKSEATVFRAGLAIAPSLGLRVRF